MSGRQLYTRAEVQGMSAGEVRENYDAIQESMRRGFAVGDPARRSRDGNGKIAAPVGPVTGRAVSRSEMRSLFRLLKSTVGIALSKPTVYG